MYKHIYTIIREECQLKNQLLKRLNEMSMSEFNDKIAALNSADKVSAMKLKQTVFIME